MLGMVGIEGLPIIAWFTIGIAAINALVMACVSMVHPREPGPAPWAFGNMLAAVGITIMTLRAPQTDPLVGLFGNAMFLASYVALWVGCARFRLRQPPWRLIAAIAGLWLAIFLWFLLVQPDITVRAAVIALALAALCFGVTWTMLRGIEPGLLQTQAFLGMLFGALGLLYLLRATAAMSGMLANRDFGGGPLGAGIFIIPALASLLATASCALMLSQRLQQRLQFNAQTDPLTGLLNRGLIDDIGGREVSRARRHGYGLALVIFDIDHIEAINRRSGYAAGDTALRRIAECARKALRLEDYVARLEGGTFCILLPSTRLAGAQQLAERLRREIATHPVDGGQPVTASFGIAALGLHGDDWGSMMQRARTALYRAKTEGRNRVEVAALSETAFQTPT